MKKSIMSLLVGAISLVIVSTTMVAPAQAGPLDCSLGGSFSVSNGGQWLSSSTSNCAGEVVIPASVTEIAGGSFSGRNITKVTFEANSQLSWLDGFRNTKITSIEIPPTVTEIFNYAFAGTPMTSISIPGKVAMIWPDAFGTNLETINLEPRIAPVLNIQSIGSNSKLKSIIVNGPSKINALVGGFVRPCFTFKGWSESLDGPPISFPYTVTGSAVKTIYPVFEPKVFTATYDSNGGSAVASGRIVGGAIEFPTAPTRAGYTFAGWYDNAGGSGSQITKWMTESNPTFYAKWLINYAANYDSKGGSAVPSSTFASGLQISEAPQDPTRAGYTFAGWSRTEGGPAISFPYTPDVAANFTLFAKWSPNTNIVNFNSKGGSAVLAGSFLTEGAVLTAPVEPTRLGYTFVGWSATDGGSVVSFPYTSGATSDITLFAIWNADTHLVDSNENGGSSVPGLTFQTDGEIALPPATPDRAGYTFVGWSATSGGPGLSFPYAPGVIGSITLFAIWDAHTFLVNFNSKGGSSVAAISFRTDGEIAVAPETPVRAGYTLVGWSATDGGPALSFPYPPGVIENITLFAIWDANTHLVNLNTKGGLALPAASFRTDGEISQSPTTPVRAGYTFNGWSATDGGSLLSFPYSPGVIENITLFAKWTRDPFKPELTTGDVISGPGFQSTALLAGGGSWLAYPQAVVSRQWYRCDKSVKAAQAVIPGASKCLKVAGANKASYKVGLPDAGKHLTVLVTSKNSIGTSFFTAKSFRAPALVAPTKVQLPGIAGSAIAKKYLTADLGTWKSNPIAKTSVQWFRCDGSTKASSTPVPGSANCDLIPGATKPRYKLVKADEGKFVTAQVTAINTQGTAATTAKSSRVALTPSSTSSPAISGVAQVRKVLSASSGSWLAFPGAKITFKWFRCNNATTAGSKMFGGSSRCVAIKNATKSRYTVAAADKGKYISVLVTAVNVAGKTTVTAESKQITIAPTKTANPSISGAAKVNGTLTATAGRWTAFPEAQTSFKWYRCKKPAAAGSQSFARGSGCVAIGGAAQSRYTITEADLGKYLSVLVKATNSAGSISATAKSTAKVR